MQWKVTSNAFKCLLSYRMIDYRWNRTFFLFLDYLQVAEDPRKQNSCKNTAQEKPKNRTCFIMIAKASCWLLGQADICAFSEKCSLALRSLLGLITYWRLSLLHDILSLFVKNQVAKFHTLVSFNLFKFAASKCSNWGRGYKGEYRVDEYVCFFPPLFVHNFFVLCNDFKVDGENCNCYDGS